MKKLTKIYTMVISRNPLLQHIDKRILNFFIIIILSLLSFSWTFWIFHEKFLLNIVTTVIIVRLIASILIFRDYSLSWSKASQKTFLIKSMVYITAALIYVPIFYSKIAISFFASELFTYLFGINFLMYTYYYIVNKKYINKNKTLVIYGAGKAGLKLQDEYKNSTYQIKYFIDDDTKLHHRSIDGIEIISQNDLINHSKNQKYDLLIVAMPSTKKHKIQEVCNELYTFFDEIKILPSIDNILQNHSYVNQLKELSLGDLLARHPQDLDKDKIVSFIKEKVVLITGAGGSIGSELVRQCIKFNAQKIILLDHSEYNLYQMEQEFEKRRDMIYVMQSVTNRVQLQKIFARHKPQIVIHAAAYKHVPMVELNIEESIINNIVGTKNCIDLSIEFAVEKFILISTDKAVRPTNVMGATKRVCELYAQNVPSSNTEIVAVRFGNVLGSSGSVIPKFQAQIEADQNITVTHPDITRYFMLISEACELVLQAGAIGKGGEVFILDMGEPVKIVDLAKKMIKLSGKDNIEIEFTGLRPGEKIYEELLIDESDANTEYDSITVAAPTKYDIDRLNQDINTLLTSEEKLKYLKKIVPEFNHNLN